MKARQMAATVAVLVLVAGEVPVQAQDRASEGARWEDLDQKVRVLERRWELQEEAVAQKTKEAASVGVGDKGFTIRSGDGAFELRIRGYVQTDGRFFQEDDEDAAKDEFLIRRARPILEGTLYRYVDFRLMPDFGGGKTVLQDAYLDAHPWEPVALRVGKFKEPFGLERLQSATAITFVERGFPTSLAPNRDVGAQLHGDLLDGALSYAAGVFNGVKDGGSTDGDTNDEKDLAFRLFAHPFAKSSFGPLKGLGVGAAATFGESDGSADDPGLPTFKTAGQQTFFKYLSAARADGDNLRFSPQGYLYWGPFGLLAEYVTSSQDVQLEAEEETLRNEAWQVAASYVLTGEDASYRGVKPKRSLDPSKGTWGALELAARYGALKVDSDTFPAFADPAKAAEEAQAWAAAANWYWNRAVKVALTYENTSFDGGAPARGDRDDEKVFFARFQVAY